jgi:hypothetical protein
VRELSRRRSLLTTVLIGAQFAENVPDAMLRAWDGPSLRDTPKFAISRILFRHPLHERPQRR